MEKRPNWCIIIHLFLTCARNQRIPIINIFNFCAHSSRANKRRHVCSVLRMRRYGDISIQYSYVGPRYVTWPSAIYFDTTMTFMIRESHCVVTVFVAFDRLQKLLNSTTSKNIIFTYLFRTILQLCVIFFSNLFVNLITNVLENWLIEEFLCCVYLQGDHK